LSDHEVSASQVLVSGLPNHMLTLGELLDLIIKEVSDARENPPGVAPF
jgi:hypothetical protein